MLAGDVCQGYHTHQPPKQGCHLQLLVPVRCDARLPLQPLTIWAIFGFLEGHLDNRKCDAPTLTHVHIWLLFFVKNLALTSESKVGLQQQLNALQQCCAECGLIMNVKKTKVMVFNFANPCQEFLFEGVPSNY
jgi:hypothetical protein